MSPCFDAVYAGMLPWPISPSIDEMPTIAEPGPASRSDGSSALDEHGFGAEVDGEDEVELFGAQRVVRAERDAGRVHEPADAAERVERRRDRGS